MVDPTGVAALAYDVLTEERWSQPANWLLVSTNPWDVLVELVAARIRAGHRQVAKISGRSTELEDVIALTEPTDPPDATPARESDG
ncbi:MULTISPECIES: hypothetical protein [unclassified Microbacterium]|uniref:hypothetical protein n=1 Tax=unclassified Microbacterium TaxID=2609290 RepID=UPI00214BD2A0|nr:MULTISPECIES: hypothetical protein [unclassified Microbacterium]MCR2783930.1 hypothetical protein [Microbacterium sp. zg.B96]WIM15226.1 hypothetical protein QNO11_11830 [Microbacterium sp. zg-B96]